MGMGGSDDEKSNPGELESDIVDGRDMTSGDPAKESGKTGDADGNCSGEDGDNKKLIESIVRVTEKVCERGKAEIGNQGNDSSGDSEIVKISVSFAKSDLGQSSDSEDVSEKVKTNRLSKNEDGLLSEVRSKGTDRPVNETSQGA
jgi:hypothetical protein